MKVLTLVATTVVALALAGPAHADITFTVTNTGAGDTCAGPDSTNAAKDCTLGGAIEQAMANADTRAVINLGPGTYSRTQPIFVDTAKHVLTVNGARTGGASVIDGGNQTYLLYLDDATQTTLNNLTLQNTKNTGGSGGAIYSSGGDLTLNTDTIDKSTVAITNDTAADGFYAGGAVAIDAGTVNPKPVLIVHDSTISDSSVNTTTVDREGGGIAAGPGAVTVSISQSLIARNTAATAGGGVYTFGSATLAMDNSTVYANSSGRGAGVADDSSAHGTISESTISGNQVAERGGSLTVARSIVDGGSTGCATDQGGTITDGGFNLDSGASCGFSSKNANPMLTGLTTSFFGGPQVLIPKPESPAIDAAGTTCPTFIDQRETGPNRPVDGNSDGSKGCDIGAVEFIPASRTVAEGTPTQTTESFTVNVTNGDAPVKARVIYGTTQAGLTSTAPDVDVPDTAPTASVAVPVTGLTPDTTYYYRVELVDGASTVSGISGAFRTAQYPAVFGQPANAVTGTTAVLNGELDDNSNNGVTYHFEYGPTAGYGTSTDPVAAAVALDSISVSAPLTGLVAGTTYHFRLVATYGGQTYATPDQTFTTTAPPKLKASVRKPARLRLASTKPYTVAVTCSRACSVRGKLGPAHATAKGGAGTPAKLRFRLSKAERKRLKAHATKALKLKVVSTPTSPAGKAVTLTATVRLKGA